MTHQSSADFRFFQGFAWASLPSAVLWVIILLI